MSETEDYSYDGDGSCETERCPRCGKLYEYCECEDYN